MYLVLGYQLLCLCRDLPGIIYGKAQTQMVIAPFRVIHWIHISREESNGKKSVGLPGTYVPGPVRKIRPCIVSFLPGTGTWYQLPPTRYFLYQHIPVVCPSMLAEIIIGGTRYIVRYLALVCYSLCLRNTISRDVISN